MSAKLKTAAATVAFVALAAIGVQLVDRDPAGAESKDVDRASAEPDRLPDLDAAVEDVTGRSAATPEVDAASEKTPAAVTKVGPMLSGQVLRADHSPAEGAFVVLGGTGALEFIEMREAPPDDLVHVVTDERGHFSLPGPFAERVLVTAGADDAAPSTTLVLELTDGASRDDLLLELRRGVRIHGEVQRKDGTLARNREIRLLQDSGSIDRLGVRLMRMITTDEAGRFDARHLCPGSWGLLTYPGEDELEELGGSMPDHIAQATVELEDGQEQFVALGARSADAVIVRGTVTGVGGPGRDFMQWMRECDDPMGSMATPELEDDGRYEVELAGPGAWYVRVFGSIGSGEFVVDIPEVAEHSLDFELPAAEISGRVLDAEGNPVKDATVSHVLVEGAAHRGPLRVADDRDSTDDDGAFRLGGLTPGLYRIGVVHETLGATATGLLRVEEDEVVAGLELTLAAEGSISGRVLAIDGGPAVRAPLWIHDAAGGIINPITRVSTDAEGRFKTPPLPSGDYSVLTQFGIYTARIDGIRVEGGDPEEVELALTRGATVVVETFAGGDRVRAHVRIHDRDGRLLTGLRNMSDPWSWQRYPFDTHRKHVGPLPAGTYTVSAHVPGVGDASEVVTVSPADEREVTLKLR